MSGKRSCTLLSGNNSGQSGNYVLLAGKKSHEVYTLKILSLIVFSSLTPILLQIQNSARSKIRQTALSSGNFDHCSQSGE